MTGPTPSGPPALARMRALPGVARGWLAALRRRVALARMRALPGAARGWLAALRWRVALARVRPLIRFIGRRVRAAGARTRLLPGVIRAGFVESWRRREARRRVTGTTIVARRDDDLSSIIGRIDTAADVELVLIVPREARQLRAPGVWPRLHAHVRRRGIELDVVAARRDVRYHARASGLHVAGSLRALRRRSRRVRVGAREFDLPALRPLRVLRWLAPPALVATATVAACYVVPSAEIVIVPPAEPFDRTVTVRVDPVAETADLDLGVLPGLTVRRTVITVLATETTGSAEIGDEHATLELLLTNDGDAPVRVAAATRVVNESGVAFATAEAVAVPAGESLAVVATAERAGVAGNLEASDRWSVSGVPDTLRIENPRPASGGTDVTVPAVAADDADRLRALAAEVLARVGAGELERAVEYGIVFPETVTVAILSRDPLAHAGEPAETLLMEVSAIVSVLVATHEQTLAYGEALLVAELPEGVALLPGATTAELGEEPRLQDGDLLVELSVRGLVAELFDPSTVREDVVGVRPAAAAAALQRRLGLAVEPQITIEPEWLPWRWLPRRGDRISIRFAGPPAVGDSSVLETSSP